MNSKRGGITLKVGEQDYLVRISTNAMVKYQDLSGESFLDGIGALQENQGDVRRMRNLFWAGVCHMDGMTPEMAGDLMDEAGIADCLEAVSEAAALAFPSDEDEAPGNGQAGKPAKKQTS